MLKNVHLIFCLIVLLFVTDRYRSTVEKVFMTYKI